jgi:adenylate kinase
MQLLIMGPPGVGKGTQSRLISDLLGMPAVSSGEIFRSLQYEDSALAGEVRAAMTSGGFVSDDVVDKIMARRISEEDCAGGFVLDGYPRTTEQADALDRLLGDRALPLDAVISVTAPDSILIGRLLARAEIEHREDDDLDVITTRLQIHRNQTAPLLELYRSRDLLVEVDGTGGVEDVAALTIRALTARQREAGRESLLRGPKGGRQRPAGVSWAG